MRILLLALFICGQLVSLAYDDDAVAELITVITATSPIPSMPSLKHLYPAQTSLFLIPALAKCKKIIVFDGIRPEQEHLIEAYGKYKANVIKLTNTDPYFANTELIFCSSWGHLCGAVEEAMKRVTTPYVFMHQHDLMIIKDFDLNNLIATMNDNPTIKYVHFLEGTNGISQWYNGPVDEVVEGVHYVPLCRSFGWSDQCHVATADYYRTFVLPQCHKTFMECVMHRELKMAVSIFGLEAQKPFGTYLYGGLEDGNYILHTDGRNN